MSADYLFQKLIFALNMKVIRVFKIAPGCNNNFCLTHLGATHSVGLSDCMLRIRVFVSRIQVFRR